jgi:hypothetical protein
MPEAAVNAGAGAGACELVSVAPLPVLAAPSSASLTECCLLLVLLLVVLLVRLLLPDGTPVAGAYTAKPLHALKSGQRRKPATGTNSLRQTLHWHRHAIYQAHKCCTSLIATASAAVLSPAQPPACAASHDQSCRVCQPTLAAGQVGQSLDQLLAC